MNNTQFITGEVIDTSYAYTTSTDAAGNTRAKGTILVRTRPGGSSTARPIDVEACPHNIYDYTVPLVGEHVTLVVAVSINTNVDRLKSRYYYTNTVNIFDNVNSNVLKSFLNVFPESRTSMMFNSGMRNTSAITANKNTLLTFKTKDIASLQPFEGDRLLQSRLGSSIRFTSTIMGNTSVYQKQPTWSGTTESPLIVIANGITDTLTTPNDYAIEDINKDDSSIYLTGKQVIDLNTAQSNIGLGIRPVNLYNSPQIILTSNRLVFNAKEDSIILSSKKTVSVSTPNWAVDMDKMFTQIDSMQKQLTTLTAQVVALTTLITSAATADTPGAIALSSLGVVMPGPSTITAGTPGITSQLSNVTAELAKITATLATLKQ